MTDKDDSTPPEPVVAFYLSHVEGQEYGVGTAVTMTDIYEGDLEIRAFSSREEAEAWVAEKVPEDQRTEDDNHEATVTP